MIPAQLATSVEVITSGPRTTVQDLGRPGHAHLGVPTSGAADQAAYRLANRLVGNPESAACLETVLGGAAVRFHGATSIALTGAPVRATLDGRPMALTQRVPVRPGQTLRLGTPAHGLLCYVAIRGGVDVARTLGSAATDTLTGLGPTPLTSGQHVPVGPAPALEKAPGCSDTAFTPVPSVGPAVLRARLGPRDDRFTPAAVRALFASGWEVTADTNRVAARLTGPCLEYADRGQLRSEGMVTGAIEVPPSGQPIVFLPDHPTTGGYPVIGVVDAADLGLLAQSRPGTAVRFTPARSPRRRPTSPPGH
ncbi:biotin-dependent carboxyltransferase [Streptomyces sp. AJS327]|uniref:5-oxoprolinase subunit C family protein n=1 Tax=Streptomyces sp. AJS327 TaxID=2545265 RepID=UPI0015DEB6B7|nr:biotin-dependent carboxyltransferase family protein [Streptomyces sp. AJS327]MBA0050917.1 biotin-dependent carboxyltransferase [Streptomyces sp. AJS327]